MDISPKKNELRAINANPFELFVMQYLSHHLKNPVPAMHREWYAAFYNKDLRKIAIEAPRASAKSHIGSVFYPLYLICEGDDEEIQTFSRSSGTTGTSVKWMKKIKKEIENNVLLKTDYGLRPGIPWDSEHILVHRDCDKHDIELYCRGKKSSARGSRGTVIIDDPQNIDDVDSETVLSRDEDWFFQDILPIMLKDQRLIFIGTGMSPFSLLSTVKGLSSVTSIEFPAENGDGKSVWPEQWSDAYLKSQMMDMGVDRYNAEYRCITRVPGDPIFREEWFQSYDPYSAQFKRIEKEGLYKATGFDGAESKADTADFTAIITVGATNEPIPNFYLLDIVHDKLSVKEGAEQLFIVYDRMKQHKSIVESRCAPPNKDAIIEEIEERQRTYRTYINLHQVRPIRDKVTRAHVIQPIIQQGRFFIDKSNPMHIKFMREMCMFTGKGKFHDDQVDGVTMALTELKGFTSRKDNPDPVIIRNSSPAIMGRQSVTGCG